MQYRQARCVLRGRPSKETPISAEIECPALSVARARGPHGSAGGYSARSRLRLRSRHSFFEKIWGPASISRGNI